MRSYLVILAALMLPQVFSIPSWDFLGEFMALLTINAAVAGVLNTFWLGYRLKRAAKK